MITLRETITPVSGEGYEEGGRQRLAVAFRLLALVVAALVVAFSSFSARPAEASGSASVLAWGDNTSGQLGNGHYRPTNLPVFVSNLKDTQAVAGGCDHSLALKNGTVWAWGDNESGQLGDGTGGTSGSSSKVPVQVKDLSGVQAIAAGCGYSLALKNGTVWAWGSGHDGLLGNGTRGGISKVPVQVKNLSGVKAIAAGSDHSLALKTDPTTGVTTVWAWGYNGQGQLGDGTGGTDGSSSNVPVQVKNLSGVKAIASGGLHSLALKNDGTAWAWGWNPIGQLGDGGTSGDISKVPVQVKNLSGAEAIAAGWSHSLALKNGTVWAWGANNVGQLGDGGTSGDISKVPVQVKNLSGAEAIAAGGGHSLALKIDPTTGVTTVWAWGDGSHGELGDGTSGFGEQSSVPVQVKNPTLLAVKTIAAGYQHNLAAL